MQNTTDDDDLIDWDTWIENPPVSKPPITIQATFTTESKIPFSSEETSIGVKKYRTADGHCIVMYKPTKAIHPSLSILKTLTYINGLVYIAKRDFPFLGDEDITVMFYNSPPNTGLVGVEFFSEFHEIPEDYVLIDKLFL